MTGEHVVLRTRPALLATFVAALESPTGAFVPSGADVVPGQHAVLAVDVDRANRPVFANVLVVGRREGMAKNLPGGAFVRPVDRRDTAVGALHTYARGGRMGHASV